MTDIRSITLSECAEILLSLDEPVVAMHVRPDGDTVGSAAALLGVFKELGKKASYICSDEIPDRLAFLLSDCERAEAGSGRAVVAIDIASPAQLGSLYETERVVLSIDHHERNTPYCNNYTVPGASSAGEVLYGIIEKLEELGKIKLTAKIAESLYAAISSDTGGFMFSNASADTYNAAARLISLGIDHAEINRRLFSSKSEGQIRAEGFAGANIATALSGKVSYLTVSKEERDRIGLPFEAFETAIDVVRSLKDTLVSFVIKETDKGEYKASLRSVGANVADIAARHGGGGHIRAAGCAVKADSIEGAKDILLCELEEILG